ncbi:DHA2 family metal-tetracycline-proton antiporter-like MFS transporter [Fontibacillus phaseoli]|uniref:DHA2 family metal-tetracycline-proton antiporter-like MFS transporter n=1 Tax=Fontibacillus phaseoli TaxID=1416533 RepID=A0A369BQK9_9BACL|nr:MFS transporter [Fontibacillus phaseoli]RCX22747.1 DHA2 family metal-tetracycline-proton antiporter-like MFS transporter [Fontibacillus phaseoli]
MQYRNEVQASRFILWLSVLTFFSVMNETMFSVSLPDIAAYFHIPPSAANWTSTCFSLSFAIGVAVYGKILEHAGLRKLLLFGMLTYGFGSVLGLLGHAWYPGVLAARLLQGAGASAIPSLIMVMIVKIVEPGKQGKAFGLIGSVVAFGEGLGPVIGGAVSGYMHWSVLFALPLLSLPALPFVLRTLPDETTVRKAFDKIGAVLLSAGILSFALFTTLYHWICLIASLVLFALLAFHLRRHREPFLEPFLFRKKRYLAGVFLGGLLLGTVAGFISMVPYLMRAVYHMLTGLIGGAILFPGTLSVILFGMLGGMLTDRRGHTTAMLSGLSMIAVGFLIILLYTDRTPWLVTGSMILTFGGLSFVKTVVSASVASTLEPDEAGSGMGMLNFVCFLAEGIGIAGVGGLLTKPWLDFPLVGTVTNPAAVRYSNMMLMLIGLVAFGGFLFVMLHKRDR